MAEKMTPNEKAKALVEMGLVRLTQFDPQKRVTGCDVAGRNLDTAQVRYDRKGGTIFVLRCHHVSRDGTAHDHECEGHTHKRVCYHARAGLMFAAEVAGGSVTFHDRESDARVQGGTVVPVTAGDERKLIWASFKAKT